MKVLKKNVEGQNGMSMVEVMIAAAMLGGIALAFSAMFKNISKTSKANTAVLEGDQFHLRVMQLLRDQKNCDANFRGKYISSENGQGKGDEFSTIVRAKANGEIDQSFQLNTDKDKIVLTKVKIFGPNDVVPAGRGAVQVSKEPSLRGYETLVGFYYDRYKPKTNEDGSVAESSIAGTNEFIKYEVFTLNNLVRVGGDWSFVFDAKEYCKQEENMLVGEEFNNYATPVISDGAGGYKTDTSASGKTVKFSVCYDAKVYNPIQKCSLVSSSQ